jgi:hypothetical protein
MIPGSADSGESVKQVPADGGVSVPEIHQASCPNGSSHGDESDGYVGSILS